MDLRQFDRGRRREIFRDLQFGRETERMARQIDVELGFAARHAGAHHLFHLLLGLQRRQEGRRDWSWRREELELEVSTPFAHHQDVKCGCQRVSESFLMLRQVRLTDGDGVLAILFGRLGTGVEGLVRIPRFASVGRVVVSADRLAGLGLAFSRTVQVVNFGQMVVDNVERVLCRRRRPDQRR